MLIIHLLSLPLSNIVATYSTMDEDSVKEASNESLAVYLMKRLNDFLSDEMRSRDEVMVCMVNFISMAHEFRMFQKVD